MKIFRILYSVYALTIFIIGFVILFPFYLLFIQREKWHKYALFVNRIWAKFFFTFIFLPVKIDFRFKLDKKKNYVFCPNHASYLDIPIVGLKPHKFVFVGKNSMEKIPFFGYMYRKLHITVDRESLRSRWNTLVEAKEALDKGISILIFPEGGIFTTDPPKMTSFKDGPFRLAIEKQIPIVPVTIPYNWIILPEENKLLRWKKAVVIYHEPLSTEGLTLSDVDSLKEKTFNVIHNELNKYF